MDQLHLLQRQNYDQRRRGSDSAGSLPSFPQISLVDGPEAIADRLMEFRATTRLDRNLETDDRNVGPLRGEQRLQGIIFVAH